MIIQKKTDETTSTDTITEHKTLKPPIFTAAKKTTTNTIQQRTTSTTQQRTTSLISEQNNIDVTSSSSSYLYSVNLPILFLVFTNIYFFL